MQIYFKAMFESFKYIYKLEKNFIYIYIYNFSGYKKLRPMAQKSKTGLRAFELVTHIYTN